MISNTEIDYIATNLYAAMSFENGDKPDYSSLKTLFYGDGLLINNSFAKPITFTTETFIQTLEAQVASGGIEQFNQREINSKTEIFGKVAQRMSVYEYSFAEHEAQQIPRGVNYINLINVEGTWRIVSMVWADENENNLLAQELIVN